MTAAASSAARPQGARLKLRRAGTIAEVGKARRLIKGVGDLSDNIVGVGPFGVGLDGVLAWIPIVGSVYSLGAGAVLLAQGWRAHVSPARMAAAAAMMLGRTAVGEIPLLGDVAVDLFRGHRYAARLLQAGVDGTLYVEGSPSLLALDPKLAEEVEAARRRGRRVVFLDR